MIGSYVSSHATIGSYATDQQLQQLLISYASISSIDTDHQLHKVLISCYC